MCRARCQPGIVCGREAEFGGTTKLLAEAATAETYARLESLSLYGNKLTRWGLVSERLVCGFEQFVVIAFRLSGLAAVGRSPLLQLNIGHNMLTSLPDEVRRQGGRGPLESRCFQSRCLRAQLRGCVHLQVLWAEDNLLAEFPKVCTLATRFPDLSHTDTHSLP